MSSRINTKFHEELYKYGAFDTTACFNCGNCTAVCSLTDSDQFFPRKAIRYAQLGMVDELNSSVEPWLCYYCGDCSDTCPRDANPGEQMMALRRYLTSVYDWTGISRKMYLSKTWELMAIFLVAISVVAAFVIGHSLYPGNIIWDLKDGHVWLSSFAPVEIIHIADWTMGGLLTFFLLSNVFNMYLKIIRSDKSVKVPLLMYFRRAHVLGINFFTQKSFSKCDDNKSFWFMHLFLVSGYIIMFVLVMLLLPWFQIDKGVNWTTPLGYYATIALLVGIIYFFVGRVKKKTSIHKFSHFSDWTFLVLLFLTIVSGILVHIFRYFLLWPAATFYVYVLHLAVVASMLMVEVPFSKWSHLAYRSIALYFVDLKKQSKLSKVSK